MEDAGCQEHVAGPARRAGIALRLLAEPVGGGGLEEIGDGNALAADEEFAGGVVGFVEGGDAGEGLFSTAAFDFDGDECIAALEHEIDF